MLQYRRKTGDGRGRPDDPRDGSMAMAPLVLGFIGLILGIALFADSDAAAGGILLSVVAGVLAGFVRRLARGQEQLAGQVAALQQRLAPQGAAVEAPPPAVAPPPEPAPIVAEPVAVPSVPPPPPEPEPEPQPEPQPVPLPVAAAVPAAPLPPPPPPRPPGFIATQLAAARAWLLGGNLVARVGVLLLFLGLAFLLRYASERVTVPIELRYAGVGLAGFALQILGWRLRARRRGYALMLQGAAVAILYLTIFAAMRLHALIPVGAGFGLLVAVVGFSTILAVVQDARALAMIAAAGGFAAPVLAATGGEHHVALFTYLLLLDAGILTVAWFKAWRPLNLIGFLGTLGLGVAWGETAYRPEMLASTEPFLIAFFLMFVAIAVLFARRVLRDALGEPPAEDRVALVLWAARRSSTLDGILLFGAPLAFAGLQAVLVEPYRHGAAFSALGLGLFYIALATVLLRRAEPRYLALVEVFIALGVVFGTLAIPLGLDARWTSAAWAIEGAGIYWIAVRQDRRLARAFGTLVQLGAAVAYLGTIEDGTGHRLLGGSRLGAAMLAGALLTSFWQRHRADPARDCAEDGPLRALFTGLGLFFLALIAPLSLSTEGTVTAWALLGLGALAAGLRLGRRSWLISALVLQSAAGLVFALHLIGTAPGEAAVLGSGLQGLLVAALIGASALAGAVLLARDGRVAGDPVALRGLGLLILLGLAFLNLAVLFVLPWGPASGVWAASGLVVVILSLKLRQWIGFGCGMALQLIGGAAFLIGAWPTLRGLPAEGLTPLAHAGFWAPATIALAAFVGAGWLHVAPRDAGQPRLAGLGLGSLSKLLLGWAALWWGFAWLGEIARFLPAATRPHAALIVAAMTGLVFVPIMRRWRWRSLALLSTLLLPAAILVLLAALGETYNPGGHWGALAWPAWLAAHLVLLRRSEDLLPARWPAALHVVGCWLALAVAALELRYGFILLSDRLNAWRWLGWAAVPACYLLAAAQPRFPARWPVSAFEREYRAVAALPVALVLLAWTWLAAFLSDGDAAPLPYLPLANPLELGQLLALFALLDWWRTRFALLPWAARVPAATGYWLLGASALVLPTGTVLRTAHHWAAIPFTADALMASMLVQASLSMLWAVAALGLMILGHARALRAVWLTGAALAGAVVVKLFLVELTNTGGLPRIISFIGVGIVLLITGYFAPLPPRRAAGGEEAGGEAAGGEAAP